MQLFLNLLKAEIEEYYKNSIRSINYEDIYYLLDFIEYNYYEDEGNPAFKYIIKEFEPKIKNLLIPLDPELEDSFDLNRLLTEAKRYIKQTVSKLLSKKAESYDGLNFLKQLLLQNNFKSIDIFTLNHDIVLEYFFNLNNIPFNDGFKRNSDKLNIWEPEIFMNEDKIKVYKLHGSINWCSVDSINWEDNRIYKIPESIIDTYDTISNAFILIGTHNKMSDYIKDLYLELYYRFYKGLNTHNKLIIIGYGFNDRGINQKIFNWLYNPSNQIIIIDPQVEEKRIKFPSYFFREWNENKRIKIIPDYIENVNWDSIQTVLTSNLIIKPWSNQSQGEFPNSQ